MNIIKKRMLRRLALAYQKRATVLMALSGYEDDLTLIEGIGRDVRAYQRLAEILDTRKPFLGHYPRINNFLLLRSAS